MLSLRRDDVTTTRTVVRITNFNPRLREGGDDIYHAPSCCKKISIHASAKEATNLEIAFQKLDRLFQSTPLRRRRPSNPTIFPSLSLFQSTPPRRRRRDKIPVRSKPHDFNPRLREGGDIALLLFHFALLQFQSTPPRRRRLQTDAILNTLTDFNPRLREGGDTKIIGIYIRYW